MIHCIKCLDMLDKNNTAEFKSNQNVQFQTNRMSQSQYISQKNLFWVKIGPEWPKFGP